MPVAAQSASARTSRAGYLSSAETDFTHAIAEVVRAAYDVDFDAHEQDRQVAPVQFWETHCVFLRRHDDLRLPFLAAVDGVEHFLLRKPVMVGEAFRVNELGAKLDDALLEALRLRDAAQRRDLPAFDEIQRRAFPGEHVFKIHWAVDAFDDGRGRIQ